MNLVTRIVLEMLSTVFILLLLTSIVALCLPIYIFRYILYHFASRVKPSIGQILTSRSTLFAMDKMYEKNPKGNVLVTLTLASHLELDELRKKVIENVIRCKTKNGELRYPELSQCLSEFWGFKFWENIKDFELNDHVKELNYDEISYCINDVKEDLLNRKWVEGKPLWEMLLCKNETLFIRFHHCLGDGFAWLNLIAVELCQTKFKAVSHKHSINPKEFKISSLIHHLCTFSRMCYKVMEWFFKCFKSFYSKQPFNQSTDELIDIDSSKGFQTQMSEAISLSDIHLIKNHFGVSFTSVILAIVAGALRDVIIKRNGSDDIPDTISIGMPLPLQGHSLKLQNYMSVGFMDFPIGECDPIERLMFCNKGYENLRNSTLPLFFKYAMVLLGSLSVPLVTYLGNNRWCTLGISNFSTGEQIQTNLPITNANVVVGLLPGCGGIGFMGLSFEKYYQIAITTRPKILTKHELDELSGSIYTHFHNLLMLAKNVETGNNNVSSHHPI